MMLPFAGKVDRDELRRTWLSAWRKSRAHLPLAPLEEMLADVLAAHPEYHSLLEDAQALAGEWTAEGGHANPFLHMGLHVALREAIAANRPAGVRGLAERLCRNIADPHGAEHRLMECLAETLWEAASTGLPPDEAAFLERARRMTGR